MRRYMESTIDKFPRAEHNLGTAVEPIAAYVLGFSWQKIAIVPSLKLNGPMHASAVAPAAIPLGKGSRKLVGMVGGHSSALSGKHVRCH